LASGFIITLTILATGSTNTSLVEIFGATTDIFISRGFNKTIELLDNKADGVFMGMVCSVVYICLGASLIDHNTANCCLTTSILLGFWIA